jgi:hypothetical protein
MLIVYQFDEPSDRVTVVTIQDRTILARSNGRGLTAGATCHRT